MMMIKNDDDDDDDDDTCSEVGDNGLEIHANNGRSSYYPRVFDSHFLVASFSVLIS